MTFGRTCVASRIESKSPTPLHVKFGPSRACSAETTQNQVVPIETFVQNDENYNIPKN